MDVFVPQILWRTKYAAAYMQDEHMVIRYRFPFSREREANLLGAYDLDPDKRMQYYDTLSVMIERNVAFTAYLKEHAVPSILYFDDITQKIEDNGVICVYCIPTVAVRPISQLIFQSDYNAMTALDVCLRLANTLRDIGKTPAAPVLRHLDLDDVYLTQDNKILLGGFYYYAADGMSPFPPFLEDASANLPDCIVDGAIGDAGTDMQTLCRIAWNLLSGLPWDTRQSQVSMIIPPMYAPPELVSILEFGLRGDPQSCNAFRKQLIPCRNALAKTAFAQTTIPAPLPFQREYRYRVAAVPREPAANTTTASTEDDKSI